MDKSLALDPEANAASLSDITSDRLPPTAEEKQKLREIAGHITWVSYLLCIVELAERASFYGCKTVLNNFLQFSLPNGGNGAGAVAKDNPNGHAGALNRGLRFASAMVLLFNFLAYVIPIFGAWLSDTKTGRSRAIMYGVIIGGVAHVIMVGGAAPAVLKAGNGLAPFMISFFLLAIGAGIFKPNLVPLLIGQYTDQGEFVKTLKSGERVIVDPDDYPEDHVDLPHVP
ncbi:peptide transporter PTR2 [Fusarium sp. NRRL 52700]|nr:peptide transporter PTR2 [Fusarium sp. NRRL 52700]